MQEYTPDIEQLRSNQELMAELLKYHDGFRKFIAILANHQCGVAVANPSWRPRFIFKCEGGVVVKRAAIVLDEGCVQDDFDYLPLLTEEEKAVVQALDQVAKHILKEGSVARGLELALGEFIADKDEAFTNALAVLIKVKSNSLDGDPWRNFFGEVWNEHVRQTNEEAKAAGKEARYF